MLDGEFKATHIRIFNSFEKVIKGIKENITTDMKEFKKLSIRDDEYNKCDWKRLNAINSR